MNKNNENPKAEEKVCFNCKYMLWLVGIGQGVKCDLDKKNIPKIDTIVVAGIFLSFSIGLFILSGLTQVPKKPIFSRHFIINYFLIFLIFACFNIYMGG